MTQNEYKHTNTHTRTHTNDTIGIIKSSFLLMFPLPHYNKRYYKYPEENIDCIKTSTAAIIAN